MQLLIQASAGYGPACQPSGPVLRKGWSTTQCVSYAFRPTVAQRQLRLSTNYCAASATPFDQLSARRPLPSRRPAGRYVQRVLEGGDALPGLPQPPAQLARDVLVEQEVRLRIRFVEPVQIQIGQLVQDRVLLGRARERPPLHLDQRGDPEEIAGAHHEKARLRSVMAMALHDQGARLHDVHRLAVVAFGEEALAGGDAL